MAEFAQKRANSAIATLALCKAHTCNIFAQGKFDANSFFRPVSAVVTQFWIYNNVGIAINANNVDWCCSMPTILKRIWQEILTEYTICSKFSEASLQQNSSVSLLHMVHKKRVIEIWSALTYLLLNL